MESLGALTELLNLGVSRAADVLNELTAANLEVRVAAVRIGNIAEFSDLRARQTVITQSFAGSVSGRAALCFAVSDGIALARLLSGRLPVDKAELDAELCGVLLEAGNVVLNGAMELLSCVLPPDVRYSLPQLHTASGSGQGWITEFMCDDDVLICAVRFRITQREIDGTIALHCPPGSIHGLLNSLLEPVQAS